MTETKTRRRKASAPAAPVEVVNEPGAVTAVPADMNDRSVAAQMAVYLAAQADDEAAFLAARDNL